MNVRACQNACSQAFLCVKGVRKRCMGEVERWCMLTCFCYQVLCASKYVYMNISDHKEHNDFNHQTNVETVAMNMNSGL